MEGKFVPFILKAHASYTEIGVLPIQLASGILMLASSSTAQLWLDEGNIKGMTGLFFLLDIAVDGWALTLLSRQNVGHASTCQTLGINTGYFMSFTIFLALSDESFCNRYLRKSPLPYGWMSLAGYLRAWGCIYILVTFLLLWKREKPAPPPGVPSSASLPSSSSHASFGDAELALLEQEQLRSSSSSSSLLSVAPGGVSHRGGHQARRSSADMASARDEVAIDIEAGVGAEGVGVSSFSAADGDSTIGGGGSSSGRWRAVRSMYRRLYRVALGTITAEAVGVFKLMDKGVTRETISLIVLIEFPLELAFAVFAGRWASAGTRPFQPWMVGYNLRLLTAALTTLLVALFPRGGTFGNALPYYLAIVATGIATSFASTLMFVSQGTFFARVSDSSMGGTYLTLLNTIANLGSAWPKFFVFLLVDMLTVQACRDPGLGQGLGQPQHHGMGAEGDLSGLACPLKSSTDVVNACVEAGGVCVQQVDGFYALSTFMIVVGAIVGWAYRAQLKRLESARSESWLSH
eukprot:jgi/Mesen1/5254/ME000263S04355